ncbi:DUF2797 domain-containing protein [Streptomyces sp. URMC 123]|uniref:DUF2797 domain-containing protein n=1 Tax=Streptomyces sp. URMC 123 TaxID=3423403 RepID=UPI003F5320DE
MTPTRVWRFTRLRWDSSGAAFDWHSPAQPHAFPARPHASPAQPPAPSAAPPTERISPLPLGADPALQVGEDRRCVGIRRGGQRVPCARGGAELPAPHLGGQCPVCSALDRSSSIAADTRLDDPRPFRVYLASFGTGGPVKVGITAAERGTSRLLEQGALASVFLAEGPLAAARRAENVLAAALGVPDRVLVPAKRRARARPSTPGERADELVRWARRARAVSGWADTLDAHDEPLPEDHAARYGLPGAGVAPDREALPPAPGDVLAGRVHCLVGADLYLETPGGLILLDSRLLSGWALRRAPAGAVWSAPIRAPRDPGGAGDREEPDALF